MEFGPRADCVPRDLSDRVRSGRSGRPGSRIRDRQSAAHRGDSGGSYATRERIVRHDCIANIQSFAPLVRNDRLPQGFALLPGGDSPAGSFRPSSSLSRSASSDERLLVRGSRHRAGLRRKHRGPKRGCPARRDCLGGRPSPSRSPRLAGTAAAAKRKREREKVSMTTRFGLRRFIHRKARSLQGSGGRSHLAIPSSKRSRFQVSSNSRRVSQ